jgi:GNAT superfamily N-acetyltransferase
MTKPKWRPKASTTLRITWGGVLGGSAWQAEPGIRHLTGTTNAAPYGPPRIVSCEVIEYRDERGLLHGVVTFEEGRRLFLMVDPDCQRQGIPTKLMQEAVKRWPIDFEKQRYTEDGAKFFSAFLHGTEPAPEEIREFTAGLRLRRRRPDEWRQ